MIANPALVNAEIINDRSAKQIYNDVFVNCNKQND